jgi:hypothetical protein
MDPASFGRATPRPQFEDRSQSAVSLGPHSKPKATDVALDVASFFSNESHAKIMDRGVEAASFKNQPNNADNHILQMNKYGQSVEIQTSRPQTEKL